MGHTTDLGTLIAGIFDEALEESNDSETLSYLAAMTTYDLLLRQEHEVLAAQLLAMSTTVLGDPQPPLAFEPREEETSTKKAPRRWLRRRRALIRGRSAA